MNTLIAEAVVYTVGILMDYVKMFNLAHLSPSMGPMRMTQLPKI